MIVVNPFNESSLAFPVLECVHILGFTCAIGTAALVNFRMLGVGLTQKSAAQVWRDTMPWTLSTLAVVLLSGLTLFAINPDVYYLNYTFLAKMTLLLLAILFYYTAVRGAVKAGGSTGWSKMAASISMVLWLSVLCGGVFIGLSATRPPVAAPPPPFNYEDFLKATPH
jgi:hypothetical protein